MEYSEHWFEVTLLCLSCSVLDPDGGCSGYAASNSTGGFNSSIDDATLHPAVAAGAVWRPAGDHIVESPREMATGLPRCGGGSPLRFVRPPDKPQIGVAVLDLWAYIRTYTNAHATVNGTCPPPVGSEPPACPGNVSLTFPVREPYSTTEEYFNISYVVFNTSEPPPANVSDSARIRVDCPAGEADDAVCNGPFSNGTVRTRLERTVQRYRNHANKTFVTSVAYDLAAHGTNAIRNFLAVHLASQDLYLETQMNFTMDELELYKISLHFEYFGTADVPQLALPDGVGDARFGKSSDMMTAAFADGVEAFETLRTDDAIGGKPVYDAMYGFDVRYSYLQHDARGKASKASSVGFALNERLCTSRARDVAKWTAGNLQFSRYSVQELAVDPKIKEEFPNAKSKSVTPGTHYSFNEDSGPGCITGFNQAMRVPLLGSNAVTNNYRSHGHQAFDRSAAGAFRGRVKRARTEGTRRREMAADSEWGEVEWPGPEEGTRDRETAAEWPAPEDGGRRREMGATAADSEWEGVEWPAPGDGPSDTDWADWANRRAPPPPPPPAKVSMAVTAQLRRTVAAIEELIEANRSLATPLNASAIYESAGWQSIAKKKFQPVLVHQITSGQIPADDESTCADFLRLAGGLDPSEFSTVEGMAWSGCVTLRLWQASHADRARLFEAAGGAAAEEETDRRNATDPLGFVMGMLGNRAHLLADRAASRAMPSLHRRVSTREADDDALALSVARLLNGTLHAERRRLQASWAARPDPSVGVVVDIPAEHARAIIDSPSLEDSESDNDFQER